jgi:hypothetical protein
MNWFCSFRNLTIIFIVLCVLISGCVSPPTNGNTSSILPDVYTAPIGGFEKAWAIVDSNSTFETDYIFYSRNWGPGEVKYTVSGSSDSYAHEQLAIDPAQIHIIPSNFTAEPNQTYRSRLFLNTSALSEEFFKPLDPNGGETYTATLNINISLQNYSKNYGDDSISLIHSFFSSGGFPHDELSMNNCSLQIRPGETRKINMTFLHDPTSGIEEIFYTPTETPLNVSLTPSDFVVKHHIIFPVILTVTADPSLIPGEYPINTIINGVRVPTFIHCNDSNSYILPQNTLTQSYFPVNVSVV